MELWNLTNSGIPVIACRAGQFAGLQTVRVDETAWHLCNPRRLSAVIHDQPMEASMKNRCLSGAGAALVATLIFSSMGAPVRADDSSKTNPGFVPDTGQINPGVPQQPTSQSSDVSNMPTSEEARAALMAPISKQPSTGDAPAATMGAGTQQVEPHPGMAGATNEPPPSGPIGSFGQTIPAKFSKRNDVLDRVPTMAIPLPLTDDQRKQIYDAVMADKSQPAAGAEALKPASELSPDQALNGMHPLPTSVRNIDGVTRLYYVKAQGKVLLVEPDVRTVVGEITPGK
jgi:hypothetical protein